MFTVSACGNSSRSWLIMDWLDVMGGYPLCHWAYCHMVSSVCLSITPSQNYPLHVTRWTQSILGLSANSSDVYGELWHLPAEMGWPDRLSRLFRQSRLVPFQSVSLLSGCYDCILDAWRSSCCHVSQLGEEERWEINTLSTEVAEESVLHKTFEFQQENIATNLKSNERRDTNDLSEGSSVCHPRSGHLTPASFFCHDSWGYLNCGGVCIGMSRGVYSSTQGSNISKPECFGEDGVGQCSRRYWGGGVVLCSKPSTRIPWKRLRSRLIRHGTGFYPLIGYDGQADVGAAAGGADDSSTSLSHCRGFAAPAAFTHNPAGTGAHWSQHTHTHTQRSFDSLPKTGTHLVMLHHHRWT